MPRTPEAAHDAISLIANALDIQAKVEKSILSVNEAEADRLSSLYEKTIEDIFSLRVTEKAQLIAKIDFSKSLLIEEHPMPSLVSAIFESLCKDVKALSNEPKVDPQKSGSS